MRETEMEVLLRKTKKNPQTDGYERDRSLRSEKKLKRNEITITETRKTLGREKTISKSRYP